MVKVEKLTLGDFEANCYILWKEGNSACLVIDPGDEEDKIQNFLKEKKLSPEAILLTHGHIDHIAGSKGFHSPIYINQDDLSFLNHPELNLSGFLAQPFRLEQKEILTFGDGDILNFSKSGMSLKTIQTPGHTPGSSCFLISGLLFSGDTIFKEGVGRTDFPQSSWKELSNSVLKKIFLLPDETRVYPGHGPDTTIGYEKRYNPFFI